MDHWTFSQVAKWILGALGATAAIITIVEYVFDLPPAFAWSEMEIHPYGWAMLAAGLVGATMGLSWPTIDRVLFMPRRDRIERFRESRDVAVRVLEAFRGCTHGNGSGNLELAYYTASTELKVRLDGLGIARAEISLASTDDSNLLALIDMMERGALHEAQRRWPP